MDDVAYIAGVEVGIDMGRKEVVDWVLNNYDDGLFLDEWKVKLEEWGIIE